MSLDGETDTYVMWLLHVHEGSFNRDDMWQMLTTANVGCACNRLALYYRCICSKKHATHSNNLRSTAIEDEMHHHTDGINPFL